MFQLSGCYCSMAIFRFHVSSKEHAVDDTGSDGVDSCRRLMHALVRRHVGLPRSGYC